FAPARPGGRKRAQPCSTPIDEADGNVGKAHDPVAGVGLGDADGFADQGLAEEDEVAGPLDRTIGAHAAHGVLGVVAGFLDALGIAAGAWLIVAGRSFLAEGLVRALVVVDGAEAIEAVLLGHQVLGRRPGGLLLERAMHALVAAVLLGRAGINALE